MLLELFNQVMLGMPNEVLPVEDDVKSVVFEATSFPEIPAKVDCSGLSIFKRQFYRGNGNVDNVRIVLDRSASTALGLWILGTSLQKRHERYVLNLTDEESEIKRIVCQPQRERVLGVNIREASFVWEPDDLERVRAAASFGPYLSQKGEISIVNEQDDWADELTNRHSLLGFGPLGASCMIAAFFLDFGLSSSRLNYDYIKDNNQSDLVDAHSCEARVELADAWRGGEMSRKIVTH
ncbi:MAG: hypothetical protein K2Y28_12695 [Burkholderiaceae bacterium]|nr:hypothetical protein [Burkholderiaceae bacterium]